MKWSFTIFLIVFGVYVLIIGFGTWLSYQTGKRLDIGYGVATSTRKVQLEIGDKVFSIPQNYIWSREDWKGGKTSGVNMQAHLPDLAGYTEQNKQEFDDPRIHNSVDILLTEHNIKGSKYSSTSMTRKEVYQRTIFDYGRNEPKEMESVSGPYGLTRQLYIDPHERAIRELYVGTLTNGKFYWVECGLKTNVPSPHCTTYFAYSNQASVSYTFSKDRLEHWQKMDNDIRNLIQRFDITSTIKKGHE